MVADETGEGVYNFRLTIWLPAVEPNRMNWKAKYKERTLSTRISPLSEKRKTIAQVSYLPLRTTLTPRRRDQKLRELAHLQQQIRASAKELGREPKGNRWLKQSDKEREAKQWQDCNAPETLYDRISHGLPENATLRLIINIQPRYATGASLPNATPSCRHSVRRMSDTWPPKLRLQGTKIRLQATLLGPQVSRATCPRRGQRSVNARHLRSIGHAFGQLSKIRTLARGRCPYAGHYKDGANKNP
ncbi:unnamed protein product [Arabidopsis thaliana]|uniref:Uncharacterized protein n=1 Tax=Arabidopsis thaliana TaxID=3702 RepID=Q9LJW4_ARATH|nr:unnamed protein product [Arabidopsis thaliana]